MNSSDTITFGNLGFSGDRYIELQSKKIYERIDKFRQGKLYLEIGGKFLHDPHASRVLPGYDVDSKRTILEGFKNIAEVIFCVNAKALANNQQLKNIEMDYQDVVMEKVREVEVNLGLRPVVSVNLLSEELQSNKRVNDFMKFLQKKKYTVIKRYKIESYPDRVSEILSPDGFGKDDYYQSKKNLIVIVGPASNSGKLSTALGQIYHDRLAGLHSGYAKFETFPIWSLPVEHPVNLAYEAATADVGDYNMVDPFHLKAYGKIATNYNRDVQAFPILQRIITDLVSEDNFMRTYRSPTDMGVNTAGLAITDNGIVARAALAEIKRRQQWYHEMVERDEGDRAWVEKCKLLEDKAEYYIRTRRL